MVRTARAHLRIFAEDERVLPMAARPELLEPIDRETGIARFLEKRGEGLHHVCMEVDDIRVSLAELKSQGVELIDEEPREGLTGTIAFLHPAALHGVLVELVEKGSGV